MNEYLPAHSRIPAARDRSGRSPGRRSRAPCWRPAPPGPAPVDVAAPLPTDYADPAAFAADTVAFAEPDIAPLDTALARRTLLPNDTALAGENFILRQRRGGLGGAVSVAQLLRTLGPPPAPFEYVIARDFVATDGFGSRFAYVQATPAEGVSCVLAVGSTPGAAGGATAVLMRNCVPGDVARALAPISSSAAF